MAQNITLEAYPDTEFRLDLDDTEYVLRLQYLERFDSWTFDLLDSDESPIVQGMPVVYGKPLLSNIVDARKPAGDLVFTQQGSDTGSPTFDSFGANCQLIYLTAEELAEAAASG